MKLTTAQALEILGRIAFLNEQIRVLLNNYPSIGDIIDDGDVQELINQVNRGESLKTEIKLTANCSTAIKALMKIAEQSEQDEDIILFLDANKICKDLVNLDVEIKSQN